MALLCFHSPNGKTRVVGTVDLGLTSAGASGATKATCSVSEEASSDSMPEIDPGSGISWRELYPSSPLGSYILTASRPGSKPSWQRGIFVA